MFGYGGNLGHPTDPENGLTYMRARFYEPWTGRFLSEDPAFDGPNWYVFCRNMPSATVDPTGMAPDWEPHFRYAFVLLSTVGPMLAITMATAVICDASNPATISNAIWVVRISLAVLELGKTIHGFSYDNPWANGGAHLGTIAAEAILVGATGKVPVLSAMAANLKITQRTQAALVGLVVFLYSIHLLVAMGFMEGEND
ncbi:hypothetical protein CCB81_02555 [Armatimonadetes bacterium Uphvl-Ar2]|nr:hypothetical protein CCB81_02555 [Armatimonadetes bacterium Uphvl-Ar2]